MADISEIHLPQLVTDLAFILGTAGVTTLIFKKLKQPVVLGYILAGLLVSPNFPLLPSVVDGANITVWGEIGVIFLLFSLGLEFSFKKLAKVGGTASITALTEVVGMLLFGYLTGKFLGWSTMDSIFLGGILSISSTTIIIRAFDELGMKSQKFVGLVFGALIVEDLVAILLMVLLSTVAVSHGFGGEAMLLSILKLAFFLALWFLGGIYLIPTFLRKSKKLMNDETLLVISVALCLLMVVLASKAGFSPALGAFIMGSILAETVYTEKIEHLTKSVKDLFGAVFFVSVGMLIDPQMLVEHAGPVILITFVTIFGKFFSSALGALISGQPLKQSIQVGLSLSQIGEFSFIIATLGVTLNVTSDFLYPIAVAVSAITTFTTPFLIKMSEPFYNLLERHLPERWKAALTNYSSGAQTISSASDWQLVLKAFGQTIIVNAVVMLGIILLAINFLAPFVAANIPSTLWSNLLTVFVALVFMSPFIWALAIKQIQNPAYTRLWRDKKYTRGPLVAMETGRYVLALLLVGFLLDRLFSIQVALIIAAVLIGVVFPLLTKRLRTTYDRIEQRFLTNLNARETENVDPAKKLLPWDAHLAHFTVSPESPAVGKTLIELAIRERYGVSIAQIERGRLILPIPRGNERLYPADRITVIGTDQQLEEFRPLVETVAAEEEMVSLQPDVSLRQLQVDERFPFLGRNIRESGIREKTMGLIVGIERDGERILNPDPDTIFSLGDIVWLAGETRLIKTLE
ncbi:cation:proton antiporter [Rufibacter glacialis]|uniref:Cation:proton antiporter n=1 Tax=Rufibacter glacialis TaxID=1259555 RepID=A0A5M8Q7L8_9BACT|nr:cation:proton antiporter [Rufibacter glacialis]KAA6431118.1 sodium:proton antiporter [Rufibacter glacialis]GGK84189.1 sodium:proton antiporter [Rufibacter glacialis]